MGEEWGRSTGSPHLEVAPRVLLLRGSIRCQKLNPNNLQKEDTDWSIFAGSIPGLRGDTSPGQASSVSSHTCPQTCSTLSCAKDAAQGTQRHRRERKSREEDWTTRIHGTQNFDVEIRKVKLLPDKE
jgi:hypothetical protein